MSLLLVFGCQNDDADLQTAKASSTAEIFIDTPIGMGTNFYFPYGAGPDNPIGSKLNAWSVDQKVSYKGTASMRFDVPNSKILGISEPQIPQAPTFTSISSPFGCGISILSILKSSIACKRAAFIL